MKNILHHFKYLFFNVVILILFSCSGGEKKGKVEPKATVLISYFDNTSELEDHKNLSKGLADMLISDLSSIDIIRIVEREKLESILSEIELASSEYFDPKTAQQLGKGLGADLILTGAFLSVEPMMRIDARIIDVGTGEILQGNKVEGNITDFFQLQNQLASLITKELDITVEGFAEKVIPKTSLSEVLDYSRSIDYLDRGFDKQATEILQKTMQNNPDFVYAETKLKAIKNKLTLIEEKMNIQNRSKIDEMLKSLNPKSKTFGNDLISLYGAANEKHNTCRIINKVLLEMDIMGKELYPGIDITVEDVYMWYFITTDLVPRAKWDKIIEVGLPYLESRVNVSPSNTYPGMIKMWVDSAVQRLEEKTAGKKKLERYLELIDPKGVIPDEYIEEARELKGGGWYSNSQPKHRNIPIIKVCRDWMQYEKEIEFRKDYIFYLNETKSDSLDYKSQLIIDEYMELATAYFLNGDIYEPAKIYSTIVNNFPKEAKLDRNKYHILELKERIDKQLN